MPKQPPIARTKQYSSNFRHLSWQPVLPLIIIAITLYVIVPQFGQFQQSFVLVQEATPFWILLAFASISGAVLAASLAYKCLAFKRIPYIRIAVVQWAGMFINRLLPAGIGGMGLSADFLYRHGHTIGRASTVVFLNNLLGFLAHATILLLSIIVLGATLPSLPTIATETTVIVVLLALSLFISIAVMTRLLKAGNIARFIRDVRQTISAYQKRKAALLSGYGAALLNTSLHITAMACTLAAFGHGFEIGIATIVLSGGVLAATASPTPGGLLGSEAGITAVLMAYGFALSEAFAVALTYRFASYWLPILPGIAAFVYARQKHYV